MENNNTNKYLSAMNDDKLIQELTVKAQQWLGEGYDEETKAQRS